MVGYDFEADKILTVDSNTERNSIKSLIICFSAGDNIKS